MKNKNTKTKPETVAQQETGGDCPSATGYPSYAYSSDGENYTGSFVSREDAYLEAFAAYEDLDSVWTGEMGTPPRSVDADSLIENVAENTTAESGDWSEGYLSLLSREVIDDLQTEMQAVWDRWEAKHDLEPEWYNISDPVQHSRDNAQILPPNEKL